MLCYYPRWDISSVLLNRAEMNNITPLGDTSQCSLTKVAVEAVYPSNNGKNKTKQMLLNLPNHCYFCLFLAEGDGGLVISAGVFKILNT